MTTETERYALVAELYGTMPVAEIAEHLGISRTTVRCWRARHYVNQAEPLLEQGMSFADAARQIGTDETQLRAFFRQLANYLGKPVPVHAMSEARNKRLEDRRRYLTTCRVMGLHPSWYERDWLCRVESGQNSKQIRTQKEMRGWP